MISIPGPIQYSFLTRTSGSLAYRDSGNNASFKEKYEFLYSRKSDMQKSKVGLKVVTHDLRN